VLSFDRKYSVAQNNVPKNTLNLPYIFTYQNIPPYSDNKKNLTKYKGKGKVIPLQARYGPEGG